METLEQRIIRHEGFCAMPKPDAKGMWEIGYGHDVTAAQASTWSKGVTVEQALQILRADLAVLRAAAGKAFPWLSDLDEVRADIIYEMCYQLGVEGVTKFYMMIADIRDGYWAGASSQMLNSQWHKETPARCEELAKLMLNG